MNWSDITVTDWILIGGFLVTFLGLGRLERSLEGLWNKVESIEEKLTPDEDKPEEWGRLPPSS